MTATSHEEVRTTVRQLVREIAPDPDVEITAESRFEEDLGFSSVLLIELAFTVETAFDLPPLPEEDVIGITTVAHLDELLFRVLAEGQGAGDPL